MLTYQDYIEARDAGKAADFVRLAIREHRDSCNYRTAASADLYDAEKNETITEFARKIFTAGGAQILDETASNMKMTSNFFAKLNMQRCDYSLGNGLTFQADGVKARLGQRADKIVKDAAYYGLIHGVSFVYWAYDHLHLFKMTEFAPLWDEETGDLGAGIRFWQLSHDKPMFATVYEPDGYVEYKSKGGSIAELKPTADGAKPYRMTVNSSATTGEVVTAHNYTALPVVPLYGSRLRQSTLIGMRSKIDAYDLVLSGFVNDLQDCAQIYWIVSGAGGATEKELSKFRERLLYRHIAAIDGDNVSIAPHTQDVPHEARSALLKHIRDQIYEDFSVIDVHAVAAGATNDHIDAAYQPMDDAADDFEYQVTDAVQRLLALQGVSAEDAEPQYKRNRVSNQKEQVEMVMMEAPYLDEETILKKFPNISSEEVEDILRKRSAEEMDRAAEVDEQLDNNGASIAQAVNTAEDIVRKTLNGAQTQSLISVIGQLQGGIITEGQAVNIIAASIGVTKDEARAIIRGD